MIRNRSICVGILLIFLTSAFGCGGQKTNYVNQVTSNYLKEYNVCNSKIEKLGNYNGLKIADIQEVLSEEELDLAVEKRIAEELENASSFEIVHERNKVRKGDFVSISFSVYNEKNEEINHVPKQILKVGAGYYDKQLETVLVGKIVGKAYTEKLIVPSNISKKELVGKTETFKIVVNSIMKCCQQKLSQSFVKKFTKYKTVDEYKEAIRKQIGNEYQETCEIEKKEHILEQLISKCEFYIDEDEIVAIAADIAGVAKQSAKINGMEFEEYIKQLYGMTKDEYYERLYEDAETQTKTILLIGALANKMNLKYDEDENTEREYNILYNEVCNNLIAKER